MPVINPYLEMNWRPLPKDIITFGRTLIIGAIILFVIATTVRIFFWQGNDRFLITLQLIFSAIFILGYASYLFPAIGKPIYFLWFAVGGAIGFIITNLLFLSFYYLFFTPYAIVLRLILKRDPLHLNNPAGKTMWIDHQTPQNLNRYYQQY